MIHPLPAGGQAFSMLSQEESHQSLSTIEAATSAFYLCRIRIRVQITRKKLNVIIVIGLGIQ